MSAPNNVRRVVVSSIVGSVLLAGAAYGVGLGVLDASSTAGPELTPRIARPVAAKPSPTPTQTPAPAPTSSPSPVRTPSPTPVEPVETPQTTKQPSKQPIKKPSHQPAPPVLEPGPALLKAGDQGDRVRDAQARLKQIAWIYGDVTGSYDATTVAAVKGFQAKRGIPVTGDIDQRTLDRLDAMTTVPSHEELFNIPAKPGQLDARCRTGRVLCIDKTSRTLRWVVDGRVQLTLAARFGSTLNDTPTREGLFHVYLMDADHVSKLYGSSMPYSMFFSGGQAVHYSSDFAAVGYYGASHGCVNIRDYDGIKWLFSQVRVGDKVVVYWS